MLSNEIRKKFLEYFKSREHRLVPSSPVVPHSDPTLLFNNAGMNQFKDVFLGDSIRDYSRAATSQKCIRVGGKHNDLENVGHTSRHLTFFEMLGNFSFGDYFKEEAVRFAWEVSTEVFQFDPSDLWASVYLDDDEAFELWSRYLPTEKIVRFGASENYWEMGDTGPCGPCSELYFDRGADYGDATSLADDPDSGRYFEFWNLVFMQENRLGPDKIEPLPNPSIDTGAGLERIVSLMLDVDSVFETDILRELIRAVENESGKKYDPSNHRTHAAFQVIADHLRCLAFAISDGAQPSNVDRGYVLRKVLRRAVRYGRQLEFQQPFLSKLIPTLINTMGEHYPELGKNRGRIEEILAVEEENFFRTLRRGGNLLNQVIKRAKEHANHISGDDAFTLKDTYGLPVEEIRLLAKDAGLVVDMERFDEREEEARERSRQARKTASQVAGENLFRNLPPSTFVGYEQTSAKATVEAIVVADQQVDAVCQDEEALIILDQTPFYAEMGGQVGDSGFLIGETGVFEVSDCQSPFNGVFAHCGKLSSGQLSVGETVEAKVNKKRRQKIANNHTATHLLHWALQEVLGEHIQQKGSVVDEKRLRFDFSHHKQLTGKEVREIEELVNERIRANSPVIDYELPYEVAQKQNEIKQFFGDKYGEFVRVIEAFDDSKELCGGTHTSRTGNLGLFRILSESSIAAGVRRIEAATGYDAEQFTREAEASLERLADELKTNPKKLHDKIKKLIEQNEQQEKQLKEIQRGARKEQVQQLVDRKRKGRVPSVIEQVNLPPKDLKLLADELLDRFPDGVVVLASKNEEKAHLLVRCSDHAINNGIEAKELVKELAPIINGSGGGKPQTAQAGGTSPENIPEALTEAMKRLA